MFANDLRSLAVLDNAFDVNGTIGRKHATEAAARQGLVYVSVGNSCPSVYATAEGLEVACSGTATKGARMKGTVITDLWW